MAWGIMADARTRLDLRRVGGGVAQYYLQRTIVMPAAPALLGTMLGVDVLEEVGAGHGAYGVCTGRG